jgi:hypothetical protein
MTNELFSMQFVMGQGDNDHLTPPTILMWLGLG